MLKASSLTVPVYAVEGCRVDLLVRVAYHAHDVRTQILGALGDSLGHEGPAGGGDFTLLGFQVQQEFFVLNWKTYRTV